MSGFRVIATLPAAFVSPSNTIHFECAARVRESEPSVGAHM